MDEAIVKDLRIVYNTPEGLNRYQKMLIQRKLKLFSEEYASIQHLNDIIQNQKRSQSIFRGIKRTFHHTCQSYAGDY